VTLHYGSESTLTFTLIMAANDNSTHGDGAIRTWQKAVSHVPGAEYFKSLKRPRDVNHLDYFRYCQVKCSKKDEWHKTWLEVVLPSFKGSGIPILEQEHNRLSKEWRKSTDETKAFWTELETAELKEREELVDKRRMVHLKEQVVEQINMTVEDYTHKTRNTLGKMVVASRGGSRTYWPAARLV